MTLIVAVIPELNSGQALTNPSAGGQVKTQISNGKWQNYMANVKTF